MRLTSKGQVTIPQEFRDKFGLQPNTEVVFKEVDGKLIIEKSDESFDSVRSTVDRLRGTSTVKMSTDEIISLMRGRDE